MTRLLLRLFPAAWRTRYGDELSSLIDDTGLTPGVVADVFRAALAERARATRSTVTGGFSMSFGPAWRHPTAWAVVGALLTLPTAFFVLTSAATYQFGVTGLAGFADPLNAWLNSYRVLDLLLVAAPALTVVLAVLPLLRIGVTRVEGAAEASFAIRLRAANLLVIGVALVVGGILVAHIVLEAVFQAGA